MSILNTRPPQPPPRSISLACLVCNLMRSSTNSYNDSGGTIASLLDIFEQVWSGGKEVTRKMNDPLLLTSAGAFEMAGSPGGLGYDSIAKCESKVSRLNVDF